MTPHEALISILEEFDPGGWYQDPRIPEWVNRFATALDEQDATDNRWQPIEPDHNGHAFIPDGSTIRRTYTVGKPGETIEVQS